MTVAAAIPEQKNSVIVWRGIQFQFGRDRLNVEPHSLATTSKIRYENLGSGTDYCQELKTRKLSLRYSKQRRGAVAITSTGWAGVREGGPSSTTLTRKE